MKRFTLHRGAADDLDEIIQYFDSLPAVPALKLGRQIQSALGFVASQPNASFKHREYSQLCGGDVHIYIAGKYKIIYRSDLPVPDVLAILHGARDIDTIMHQRLG